MMSSCQGSSFPDWEAASRIETNLAHRRHPRRHPRAQGALMDITYNFFGTITCGRHDGQRLPISVSLHPPRGRYPRGQGFSSRTERTGQVQRYRSSLPGSGTARFIAGFRDSEVHCQVQRQGSSLPGSETARGFGSTSPHGEVPLPPVGNGLVRPPPLEGGYHSPDGEWISARDRYLLWCHQGMVASSCIGLVAGLFWREDLARRRASPLGERDFWNSFSA
jgi:hypothetical protein